MKYTAIADVSRTLLELFRKELVPEILPKPEAIGLCSPDNKGDFQVGVYLYSVEQSDSLRISGRQNVQLHKQKLPPVVLDLYYMITPYYKGDVKFLANEEQILLGRLIQIINDNSSLEADGENIVLELCSPTLDDKQKIWNSTNPYKTSVFMSAKAVIVESGRDVDVARVTEFIADTKMKDGE